MTTRYGYVPYTAGRNLDSDTRLSSAPTYPAGTLIATTDGSEPAETHTETLDGRYSRRVSRRAAERAFGREHVESVRDAD